MPASPSIRPQHHHPATRGFSLIELLLALAIMGLASSLIIMSSDSVFRGVGERPIPDLLQDAVREARYHAGKKKESIQLRFDEENASFVISANSASELSRIPTGYDPEETSLEVNFYGILPSRGDGFPEIASAERILVDHVIFAPDRTSTPFEVEIRVENESSRHRFDPFSEIEMKEDAL